MQRVGFFRCRFGLTASNRVLILVHDYHSVADDDYIDDDRFGALIGSNAFRKAMQFAYDSDVGLLHVHLHNHYGIPRPSNTDLRETRAFVPDFFNVRPNVPHGAVILSRDKMSGRLWSPSDRQPYQIDRIVSVGTPLRFLSQS